MELGGAISAGKRRSRAASASLRPCSSVWESMKREYNKQLSVLSCQLSVVSCQLSVVSSQLSVVSSEFSVVSCRLSVLSCRLSVVGCQLAVVGSYKTANTYGEDLHTVAT